MSDATLWTVIITLAVGSYALRFLFLGMVGDRPLPPWMLRLLRYTAVAILPALVTPIVLWPQGAAGGTNPLELAAALVTLAVGFMTRSVLGAVFAGAAVLLVPALLA
ncbi:MAG: AzlD domain-containing protein [Pseudomonadota bacterium]